MTWIWLGLVITLTLLEILTSKLVTIWYVVSAIVSLILSLFLDIYIVQFLVFVVLGTVLLFTTRDYLLNILKENEKLDRILNMTKNIGKKNKKTKKNKK